MAQHSRAKSVQWTVGGMDCAACAGKVRGAVERLPGVEAVEIALISERLTARLTPGGADAEAVERAVTRLGYTMTRVAAPTAPRLILPGETGCGCGGCGCDAGPNVARHGILQCVPQRFAACRFREEAI